MAKNKIKFDPAKYRHRSLVIDTSVLSKIFLEEEGSDVVDELMRMRMHGDVTIFATPLIVYEFLNVLAKTIQDPSKVRFAYKKFKDFNIGLVDPGDKYVDEAVDDVCENKSVSYYDASYHALARDMDAVFLTADKKYYDAMNKKGRVVLFG